MISLPFQYHRISGYPDRQLKASHSRSPPEESDAGSGTLSAPWSACLGAGSAAEVAGATGLLLAPTRGLRLVWDLRLHSTDVHKGLDPVILQAAPAEHCHLI